MKYIWLGVATLSLSLSLGESPLALAVWLTPIFLLRFTRQSTPLAGFLTALPAVAIGTLVAVWGLSPVPFSFVAISVLVGAILYLFPFLLDRLFVGRLGGLPATLLLPCASVGMDWVKSLLLGNGSSPAYSIRDDLSLLQLVSITGIWGLVFLPRWVAAVVNTVWEHGFELRGAWRPLAVLATVLVLVQGFGEARLAHSTAAGATKSIRVAGLVPLPEHRQVIAENIGPLLSGTDPEALDKLRQLGQAMAGHLFAATEREAKAGAKLVVWSEAAIPLMAEDEDDFVRRARELAAARGIYLAVTSGVMKQDYADLQASDQPFLLNKLLMITPDGEVAWDYLKARPVPFMETHVVPGDGLLPALETPVGLLTGVICYDLDHPALMRQAGRDGVELLMAPSNDWRKIKSYHSHVARIRAIENGFALLRPTSEGLSIAVDAYGRMVGKTDYFTSGEAPLVAELPLRPVSTVYTRIGDLFVYICLGGVLILVIFARRSGSPSGNPSSR